MAHTNALIHEDSPYLQQHAHNPVDWMPWGEAAFAKARKEHKLIFLSIGYSTCHWCHVMEHESFENPRLAQYLNAHFVAIKVDREEMPQIDRYYQNVYQLMHRRGGGWPLTIIMTPDRKPFFSGTYIPLEAKYGSAGLWDVLRRIVDLAGKDPRQIEEVGTTVLEGMKQMDQAGRSQKKVPLNSQLAKKFVSEVAARFDARNGGIGKAPKFPHASTITVLLQIYRLTGDKKAFKMATSMLDHMARGGIYDQIEGGFYRYSTDGRWMIPHFEKMLYTNAELIEAYANGYALSKNERFLDVIERCVENIKERFYKDGLFFSASDADSEGEEGKYFLIKYDKAKNALKKAGFSKGEIDEALGYFGIFELDGNFEAEFTNPYITSDKKPKRLDEVKKILKELRADVKYPFIDYKVQTSWNALYIRSLLKASKLTELDYTKDALSSLDTLLKTLYIDGELYHQVILGKKPKVKGYLEDYAFLISALIEAYESSFKERYLKIAQTLQEEAVKKFYKDGVWHMSSDGFLLEAELYDSSYRSALAVMIEDILSLGVLKESNKLFSFGVESLKRSAKELNSHPLNFPYATKVSLEATLSPVIVKSNLKNLQEFKKRIPRIKYPFILTKPSNDEKFLACKIDRCFSVQKSVDEVISDIETKAKR